MATKKSKFKQQINGPTENEDGQLVAEDGGEVTPALQEIYEFAEEKKEQKLQKVYKDRGADLAPIVGSKPVLADTLNVPKYCEHCYLQDKCTNFDPEATCYYRTKVSISEPADMIELLKMMIEMQGERVLFGRFIEQTEGGYVDRNLSEEIKRLMDLMKDFKDLMSEREEISIKVKGKEAVKSAGSGTGILSEIFGSGGKKNNDTD